MKESITRERREKDKGEGNKNFIEGFSGNPRGLVGFLPFLPGAELALFDGSGGGDGAASGGGGDGAAPGAGDGSGAKDKGGAYASVKFGVQPPAGGADPGGGNPAPSGGQPPEGGAASGGGEAAPAPEMSPKERLAAWRNLIQGEYKPQYDAEMLQINAQHTAQVRGLEERLGKVQPILDALSARYGVQSSDLAGMAKALDEDSSYWDQAAEAAGMTSSQYKQMRMAEARNQQLLSALRDQQARQHAQRQYNQWTAEAAALQKTFPDFSLEEESRNPRFLAMLRAGVPVEHAYKVMHMDQIMQDSITTAASNAAAQAEQRVADNVRARGARPLENGAAAGSGFTVKDDVTKLTKADRREIARRVARGERISFS